MKLEFLDGQITDGVADGQMIDYRSVRQTKSKVRRGVNLFSTVGRTFIDLYIDRVCVCPWCIPGVKAKIRTCFATQAKIRTYFKSGSWPANKSGSWPCALGQDPDLFF